MIPFYTIVVSLCKEHQQGIVQIGQPGVIGVSAAPEADPCIVVTIPEALRHLGKAEVPELFMILE